MSSDCKDHRHQQLHMCDFRDAALAHDLFILATLSNSR